MASSPSYDSHSTVRQGSVSSLSDHFPTGTINNAGNVVFSPSSANSPDNGANPAAAPRKPKPRSCITCRRRKVRCNKNQPCSNCLAHHIPCEMPSAMRQKRKKRSKKPETEELLDRLRRLEGMVEGIGKEKGSVTGSMEPTSATYATSETSTSFSRGSTEPQFGRLVIEEGKSRYVNDTFWSALNDEVNGIKTLIDDSTEDETKSTKTTPDSTPDEGHHEFMFSYSSAVVNMRAFHPKPNHVNALWEAYKANVEPLVKIVHMPTFEPEFKNALSDLGNISKPMEAMVFAIYFSAVTSLSEEECKAQLKDEKQKLLDKYKFALEQALSRAGFLSTQNITTLSAFVLFLIASRFQCTTRLVWSLTGVAVRLAVSLGLHRDGTLFNISPFDTEMRRRLWWHVVILDNRVSEDQGSDPTITEESFDTRFSLNINDSDIWPGMVNPPKERVGGTDMTFPIVRQEITRTYRRLTYVPPSSNIGNGATASLEQKVRWIEETSARLESKYLSHMDMSLALNWATATIARLIMAKLWLIVHHPFQHNAQTLPPETRDRLFHVSIDVIEYSTLLKTDKETKKWAWMHRTYVQWHAVAFLLKELCDRPTGPEVERAWAAVDNMWNEWGPASEKRSGLWKLLRSLLVKACAARPPDSQARDPLRGNYERSNSLSNPILPFLPAQTPLPGGTTASYHHQQQQQFGDFVFNPPRGGPGNLADPNDPAATSSSRAAARTVTAQDDRQQQQQPASHLEFGIDGPDVLLSLDGLDWAMLDGADDSGTVSGANGEFAAMASPAGPMMAAAHGGGGGGGGMVPMAGGMSVPGQFATPGGVPVGHMGGAGGGGMGNWW